MMTQPNSNSPVHPLSSGGACPNTAGTNPQEQVQSELASAQIRALLSDERAQQPDFYLHHFNADQRAELAAAARKTLDDEVVMLRTAIKSFFQAVRREEDADAIERMADSLNLLGLSCSRLGNVLKINQALQGAAQSNEKDALYAELMERLALENLTGGEENG